MKLNRTFAVAKSSLTLALTALLAQSAFLAPVAKADFAISLGEQKARPHEDNLHGRFMRFLYDQGSGDPGHAVLYVSDLCNDDSYFHVRMCRDGDEDPGVYISFISHLSGGHSWIAVPPAMYLYGVKNMEDRPLFATSFNRDYYGKQEAHRKADKISEDGDYKESRTSSLDMVRYEYLGGPSAIFKDGSLTREDKGKTVGAADKVNVFVTSERDVYNIVIHGDTRAQAQKLLDHFNTVENQAVRTNKDDKTEQVEGTFGWWTNCAATVNKWTAIAFGNELAVSPALFELKIENPRHYGRVLLEKIANLKKQGKFPFPVSIDYLPKVASDRDRSTGFGSPAAGFYDPRTLDGAAFLYSHPEVSAFFYVVNWKNIHFKMDKKFENDPSLTIAQLLDQLRTASTEEERKSIQSQIDAERTKYIGTKDQWASVKTRTTQLLTEAAAIPGLPAELTGLLSEASKSKLGKLGHEVAIMMAYRSQAMLDSNGDSHRFQFHFKDVSSGKPGADESTRFETSVSRSGLAAANNPLSLMLTLAALDDYASTDEKNHPSWPEMQADLALAEQVVAQMKAPITAKAE